MAAIGSSVLFGLFRRVGYSRQTMNFTPIKIFHHEKDFILRYTQVLTYSSLHPYQLADEQLYQQSEIKKRWCQYMPGCPP
jgi:hypothetical protein